MSPHTPGLLTFGNLPGARGLAGGGRWEFDMADELKAGDKVKWESSQGEVKGEVVKKVTRETQVKGYKAKASKAAPQYVVKSDKTGAEAVHKPEGLKKG